MSKPGQVECHAYLLRETDNAMQVQKEHGRSAAYWIPRSQVGYLKKTKLEEGRTQVTFTMPEWLAEKNNCWEIVTS